MSKKLLLALSFAAIFTANSLSATFSPAVVCQSKSLVTEYNNTTPTSLQDNVNADISQQTSIGFTCGYVCKNKVGDFAHDVGCSVWARQDSPQKGNQVTCTVSYGKITNCIYNNDQNSQVKGISPAQPAPDFSTAVCTACIS